MCSNKESTKAEPHKNICLDQCAARIRGVIKGYGKQSGTGGDFAYVDLLKFPPADAGMDVTPDLAFQLLSFRHILGAAPFISGSLHTVASTAELAVIYIPVVTPAAIKALLKLPQPKLAVYSTRPQTIAQQLESSGKQILSYAVSEAIFAGQAGGAA